jgi:FkbM family methyltransferase
MLASVRECAPMIGWKWAILDRLLKKVGVKEVRLKAVGLDHPIACRTGTSDIFEFTHLLGWKQVPLELPIRPMFIVDAGANVGYSSLRFQKDFPGASIVALEPEPRNIIQFKKNCGPYSNILLDEKALWSSNTRLRIRSLDADSNAFRVEEDQQGDVDAISVDEVMRRHQLPRIDFLKIDIEGSERAVFSHPNAKNWLRSVATIMVETHDRFEQGCSEAVERALECDFHFHGIIGEYALYISRRIERFR